ncbi:MAG: hypothetical protein QG577_2903 [Thermodesulfobacteriota bacterium]|nr:hypothetical protein [Thermodesulfobacteriota bacterium]
MSTNANVEPFIVKDCALLNIATGKKARNLTEMRDHLLDIPLGSIYHHFWGGLLRYRFDEPEYKNDFAEWVRYALQDAILAERLSVIDPVACADLECLRQQLLEVMEQRLDETAMITWAEVDMQFHFVSSQILVFYTGETIGRPEQLVAAVSKMSVGSLFYHFIDARRRSPEMLDDFRLWLKPCGDRYEDLCSQLASVDPYFVSLEALRTQLTNLFSHFFQGVSE